MKRLCARHGAFEIRVAADDAERALIWKGRKSAFAAVGRISPDYIVQDGVIPRTALPEVLRRDRRAVAASAGVRVANVFHAGDGNLHPLVLFDDAIDGAAERGRGGVRADPRPLPAARRLDHRRARRRLGQGQAHAGDVQRRRPGHHAAGALRVRPGRAVQPGQGVPDPAAVRRGAGPAPRRAPAGRGRPGGACSDDVGRRSRRAAAATDGHAAAAGEADAVDGVRPGASRRRARPRRPPRSCGRPRPRDLAVVARGAGTKLGLGHSAAPARPRRRHRPAGPVVEHAAGDLVVIVQPGVPLRGAERAAGRRPAAAGGRRGGAGHARSAGARDRRCRGPRRLLHGARARPRPRRDRWSAPTAWSPRPAARWSRTSPATTWPSSSPARTARSGWSPRPTSGCTRSRPRPAYVSVDRAGTRPPPYAAVQRVLHGQFVPSRGRARPAEPGGPVDGRASCRGHRGRASPRGPRRRLDALGDGAPRRERAGLVGPAAGGRGAGEGDGRAGRARPGCWTAVETAGPAAVRGSRRRRRAARRAARRTGAADARHRAAGGRARPGPAASSCWPRRPPVRSDVDVGDRCRGWTLMRRVKDQFDPDAPLAPGRFVGGI